MLFFNIIFQIIILITTVVGKNLTIIFVIKQLFCWIACVTKAHQLNWNKQNHPVIKKWSGPITPIRVNSLCN